MSSKYLVVPSTGQRLTDGTIVMLSRFPGMKWIVHYGWYTYNNQQCQGWYFNSIPSNTVIPATDEELMLLTVVSTNTSSSGCECNPNSGPNNPPSPTPPGPPGGPGMSPQQAYELNRAWISVDTIAIRDELNKRLLPDGKVVRVNRATEDGKPKYFIWNQVTECWDDFILGGGGASGLTKEEADKLYASKSIETNIDDTVKEVAESVVPDLVSKEIEGNETISDLKDRISDLEDAEAVQEWQSWPELT